MSTKNTVQFIINSLCIDTEITPNKSWDFTEYVSMNVNHLHLNFFPKLLSNKYFDIYLFQYFWLTDIVVLLEYLNKLILI